MAVWALHAIQFGHCTHRLAIVTSGPPAVQCLAPSLPRSGSLEPSTSGNHGGLPDVQFASKSHGRELVGLGGVWSPKMAAAIVGAVSQQLIAKAHEVNGIDDVIHHDEDVEDACADHTGWGHHSKQTVHMAASGETESIRRVVMTHRIRALRAESEVGQTLSSPEFATMQNLREIAKKRETTWTEVWMIYIAFLAFDTDGSGELEREEIAVAMKACGVPFRESEAAGLKADEEYTLMQFIDLVTPRRRSTQKWRQQVSAFYHSGPAQFCIAFLLLVNFCTNIADAHINPRGEESDFEDKMELVEV